MADEVGLPDSPVVDGNRMLRPEWLHALAAVEELGNLKRVYDSLNSAGIGELTTLLQAMTTELEDILARPIPNNLAVAQIDQDDVGSIDHGLNTFAYIPTAEYRTIFPSDVGFVLQTGSGGAVVSIQRNNWTFSPALSGNVGAIHTRTWAITDEEGIV